MVDVETTGLHSTDRIVSFAGILIAPQDAGERDVTFRLRWTHLVFDPVKKSHPDAERVHGFDDWCLRHQDRFADHADQIADLFEDAAIVVGHNLAFDLDFVAREMELSQVALPKRRTHCTMKAWRASGIGRSARLDAVAAHFGLKREGARHGALEDAWLTSMIFLKMEAGFRPLPFSTLVGARITNLREVPPLPPTGLPRRNNKRVRAMRFDKTLQATWVRIDERAFDDVEILTRGHTAEYLEARAQRLGAAEYLSDGARTDLLREHLILGVRNFVDDGQPVSLERFLEMLGERRSRQLRRACEDAAAEVTARKPHKRAARHAISSGQSTTRQISAMS